MEQKQKSFFDSFYDYDAKSPELAKWREEHKEFENADELLRIFDEHQFSREVRLAIVQHYARLECLNAKAVVGDTLEAMLDLRLFLLQLAVPAAVVRELTVGMPTNFQYEVKEKEKMANRIALRLSRGCGDYKGLLMYEAMGNVPPSNRKRSLGFWAFLPAEVKYFVGMLD